MAKPNYNKSKSGPRSGTYNSSGRSMRVPPQDIQAEKALLGSIMVRGNSLPDIADMISLETFYVDKHRIIFEAMLELYQKSDPIDVVSISSRLKEKKQLDKIGGATYLAELSDSIPSATNANYYAEVINKKFLLRQLISAGDHLTELGFNEIEDIEYVLDSAEKHVFQITSQPGRGDRLVGIKDIIPLSFEALEKLAESDGELRGVPSGFTDLDKKLSGFHKADLIILAARPSMGKTSLSLDIARQAAVKGGIPVGYFSLEMSSQQLVDRMLSAEARVDAWKMRTGKALNEADFGKISEAMDRLSKAPIYIDDQPGNSILRMRSTARRLKAQHGLGLIVVDYLQLMTTSKNYDSMVNQVTEISRSLKALARELEVPVIALSQLSRAVEARGGRPRLSDLRDSGAIEQDADVVMFIHRERNEDGGGRQNMAEILIEKHRNGATGKVDLFFDGDRATFMNIEKQDYEGFGAMAAGSNQDGAAADPFGQQPATEQAPNPFAGF